MLREESTGHAAAGLEDGRNVLNVIGDYQLTEIIYFTLAYSVAAAYHASKESYVHKL